MQKQKRLPLIYLPQPNENNIIPQDDTYLNLKDIDLSKYKNQEHVGSIFLDYSLSQVNTMQVSKQASIVMLMYLLEHKFSTEVKMANYTYYEARTLHDSSLSLSTHAVLANDLDNSALSYYLYRQAADIDLGLNMKSSDHGIHSASLGGVWQIIVCGFGGIRMVGGALRIEPKLPAEITRIEYPLIWKGNVLKLVVNQQSTIVYNHGPNDITFVHKDKEYQLSSNSEITIL